jgi:hypothetical protein
MADQTITLVIPAEFADAVGLFLQVDPANKDWVEDPDTHERTEVLKYASIEELFNGFARLKLSEIAAKYSQQATAKRLEVAQKEAELRALITPPSLIVP